ncbi:hypothetical protein ACH5RR_037098 [Cinchona calisaya]|uniref:Uncharacterized protein n=1 Tax=Cinchona calisaya TaxID=153742 RepID=A0ABD2Y555_9GENT
MSTYHRHCYQPHCRRRRVPPPQSSSCATATPIDDDDFYLFHPIPPLTLTDLEFGEIASKIKNSLDIYSITSKELGDMWEEGESKRLGKIVTLEDEG